MKLSEILEQVDIMVPNSLTTSLKISWINQIQNEFYRDYPVPDASYAFTTVPSEQIYTLPDDCAENRITSIVIDNLAYTYAASDLPTLLQRYWTIVAEQLLIYPIPTKECSSFIYYRQRPSTLTEDDLDNEPTFPADFQEMLVLGCAFRVAKTTTEYLSLASVYENDFYRLADRAKKTLSKPKQRTVTMTRGWR